MESDLDKALSGKPLKTRNGNKVYIYCVMPNYVQTLMVDDPYILIGAIFDKDIDECLDSSSTWTKDGMYYIEEPEGELDIIGIWDDNNDI